MEGVKIQLSGEARLKYDTIHHLFENDSLTITSRYSFLDAKFNGKIPDKFNSSDVVTNITVVGDTRAINEAVDKANEKYPNSTKRI